MVLGKPDLQTTLFCRSVKGKYVENEGRAIDDLNIFADNLL